MALTQLCKYTDQELLVLIIQDNRAAFDQVYFRYWKKLLLYSGKIVKDEDESKDIVQEVFISLWKRRAELSDIISLSSYLHGAIRFRSLGYIRNNLYKNNYLASLKSFFEEGVDMVNEYIDLDELSGVIDTQISKLPPKMREIFVLSRVEQMTHREIAEHLNISDKTVKKQINRSLNLFRLVLNEKSGSLLLLAILSFFTINHFL
ncbi:RNA polymerase sigma-70 factor [Pedobacter sp. ASV1-7]|uniref:RNA polymerase sigma-70 factor n=1 Tax=Pedobacter sp. ASV1-7 TaxID=3145237 RepID=UPI0032E8F7B1